MRFWLSSRGSRPLIEQPATETVAPLVIDPCAVCGVALRLDSLAWWEHMLRHVAGLPAVRQRPATIPPLDDDQIETLVDLARRGRESDFRDLAAMLGVASRDLDDLWAGTRRRLSLSAPAGRPDPPLVWLEEPAP